MKALFFDTGPIISLTMNNSLWILHHLKEQFNGNFYITPAVKYELIDHPLNIKRFELEAIQVAYLLKEKTLEIYQNLPEEEDLLKLANSCFSAKERPLSIVQGAEIETLAAALKCKCNVVVIDERTVRLLIEDPNALRKLLETRLHQKVRMDKEKVAQLQKTFSSIKIIRSVELVALAFKMKLFDHLIPDVPNGRRILLDALLWGVKTDGNAVTSEEIEELKKLLLNRNI